MRKKVHAKRSMPKKEGGKRYAQKNKLKKVCAKR